MVLVNGIEAWLETPAGRFALSAARSPTSSIPMAICGSSTSRIEPWPTWMFRAEDGTEVSQEVVACHERSHVILRWRRLASSGPVQLMVRPLLSGRDYHALHHEKAFDSTPRSPARVLLAAVSGRAADLGGDRRQLPA